MQNTFKTSDMYALVSGHCRILTRYVRLKNVDGIKVSSARFPYREVLAAPRGRRKLELDSLRIIVAHIRY